MLNVGVLLVEPIRCIGAGTTSSFSKNGDEPPLPFLLSPDASMDDADAPASASLKQDDKRKRQHKMKNAVFYNLLTRETGSVPRRGCSTMEGLASSVNEGLGLSNEIS